MRHHLAAAALAILAVGGLAACGPAQPKAPSAADVAAAAQAETTKLTAYLDAQFEQELAMSPERATQLGRKDNYGEMN
ncbi:MAG TPA: hypothetical protein VG942_09940, partial [Hyphomonadaceae bacterium]|nr:hypothetical protein [Hyphomonadaceae bacterium]